MGWIKTPERKLRGFFIPFAPLSGSPPAHRFARCASPRSAHGGLPPPIPPRCRSGGSLAAMRRLRPLRFYRPVGPLRCAPAGLLGLPRCKPSARGRGQRPGTRGPRLRRRSPPVPPVPPPLRSVGTPKVCGPAKRGRPVGRPLLAFCPTPVPTCAGAPTPARVRSGAGRPPPALPGPVRPSRPSLRFAPVPGPGPPSLPPGSPARAPLRAYALGGRSLPFAVPRRPPPLPAGSRRFGSGRPCSLRGPPWSLAKVAGSPPLGPLRGFGPG
jgi:hypothetical protein